MAIVLAEHNDGFVVVCLNHRLYVQIFFHSSCNPLFHYINNRGGCYNKKNLDKVKMNDTLNKLKKIAVFASVPEDQLQWLMENSQIKNIPAGVNVVSKGDILQHLIIMLAGAVSIKSERNGQFIELFRVEQGGITGLLPYSRAKTAPVYGTTTESSQYLMLDKSLFPEMIQNHHELTEALVHVMSDRVREMTRLDMHNEKLVSLGKISAGLAHELNNPSSVLVRAASELQLHLGTTPGKIKKVIKMQMSDDQVRVINELLYAKLDNKEKKRLSLMERSTVEDEIFAWLENHDVEASDSLSATFAEFGITEEDLDNILNVMGQKCISPALDWLDNNLVSQKLLEEIKEASRRINELVTSIKSYSQMDMAPDKQSTDVRQGIESTLTMLGHKIKKKNIAVELHFKDAPEIKAYVGQLNQVWTNVIDNAIDAMDKNGVLKIITERQNEFLWVRIIDNGPGIPEDIKSQIFDPFFSTKKFGEGTGLGLDIVRRIMNAHNAQIKVKSQPGETEFRLCFHV
jgi:signal transduction histidine kinase